MIQVTSQKLIGQEIMKEKSTRFVLAYSSPLLQPVIVNDLGCSGEGELSINTLQNNMSKSSSDTLLKDLMKIFHQSSHNKHILMYLLSNRTSTGHTVMEKNIRQFLACIMDTTKHTLSALSSPQLNVI